MAGMPSIHHAISCSIGNWVACRISIATIPGVEASPFSIYSYVLCAWRAACYCDHIHRRPIWKSIGTAILRRRSDSSLLLMYNTFSDVQWQERRQFSLAMQTSLVAS